MDHYQPLAELIGFKGINADFLEEMLPSPDSPLYLTDGNDILIRNGRIEKLRGAGYLNDITSQRGTGAFRRILATPIYENYDQEKYLMVFTPKQVEYLSNDTGYSDIGALDGSNDSIVSFANIDNKSVFTLNDDPVVRYWNGIAYGELVNKDLIRSRFLMKHKTWLMLVRPLQFVDDAWVERYQEIWASYPGNPAVFEEEDRLMIDSGGAINGCRSLDDAPIIYFPGSIHRVYLIGDVEGFGSMPIAEDEGLHGARTLTGGGGIHYFLTKRGMCGMRLGQAPVPLSWSKFNKLIVDGIDPLYYSRAIARFFEDTALLYIAFPPAGHGDNGTLLIYDTLENELVGKRDLTGMSYSSFGSFEKDLEDLTPDERRAYGVGGIPLIGTSDGHVLEQKYTTYQIMSSTYESGMTLPPIFCRDRHRKKRVMQADLILEKLTNEDITFVLELKNEDGVVTTVTKTLSGPGNVGMKIYKIPGEGEVGIDAIGQSFVITIKDSNNAYGFKFHGIALRGYLTAGLK